MDVTKLTPVEVHAMTTKAMRELMKAHGIVHKGRESKGELAEKLIAGLGLATEAPKPPHSCKRCRLEARSDAEVVVAFGYRMLDGKVAPQGWCRACRNRSSYEAKLAKRAAKRQGIIFKHEGSL